MAPKCRPCSRCEYFVQYLRKLGHHRDIPVTREHCFKLHCIEKLEAARRNKKLAGNANSADQSLAREIPKYLDAK